MRFTAILGSVLLLSGCAVPPLLTALSFAADGVSWASTGKSVTDHGISAAMNQDCALWRVVDGRSACVLLDSEPLAESAPTATPVSEAAAEEVNLAAADPDQGARAAAEAVDERQAAEIVRVAMDVRPLKPKVAVAHGFDNRYLVIASATSQADAKRMAKHYRDLGAMVRLARVDGRTHHRVVIGPFGPAGLEAGRQQAELRGARGAWSFRPCTSGDVGNGCARTAMATGRPHRRV
jgi:SPOR domain